MLFFIISIFLIIIDQLTKYLALIFLKFNPITIIDGILELTFLKNSGAAWGIFSNHTYLLVVVTLIMMIAGGIYFSKNKPEGNLLKIALTLIYSGGIANMIDRVFRDGGVIDMIRVLFIDFPVFNVADMYVCIGAFLLCVYVFFYTEEKDNAKI